jgi:transposase
MHQDAKGGGLLRRHERSDEQDALSVPHLPKASPTGGRPWAEHRTIRNGLVWKLRTGAQWRDIPECYGCWKTSDARYRHWCREGRFARILLALRAQLDARAQREWEPWWIESTRIRARRAAAGARTKGDLPPTPPTMRSGARAAATAPRSIAAAMAVACPWRCG